MFHAAGRTPWYPTGGFHLVHHLCASHPIAVAETNLFPTVDLERLPVSNTHLVRRDKGNDHVLVVRASPHDHHADQVLVAFSAQRPSEQHVVHRQLPCDIQLHDLAEEGAVPEESAFLCTTLPM